MRGTLSAAFLLVCTLGLLHPGLAAGAESPRASVLDGVPGLERRVSVTETKIPLGELIERMAGETGAPLDAAPEVADEPVAAIVKAYPAQELLIQIAELLDYRWRRRGKEGAWRYEIYQDLAAKQREEALRAATVADARKRFQREVQRAAALATLSDEEFQHVLDAEERFQRDLGKLPPDQRRTLRDTPEAREHEQRLDLARRLWSPIHRATMRLVNGLSPRQWALVRERGELTFSTDPQPGELPLPHAVASVYRAHQPSQPPGMGGLTFSDPQMAEAMRHREEQAKKAREQWAVATGYRVTIQDTANERTPEGLGFSASAGPLRSGAPTQPSQFGNETFISLGVLARIMHDVPG